MKTLLLPLVLLCFLNLPLQGQMKVSDVGIATAWGYALNGRSIPEGTYRLAYFQGVVRLQILPSARRKGIFQAVYWGAEPQYNLVWVADQQQDFELGVHFFLQPTFRLSERYEAFFILGIGPHYFSTQTVSQARGFIFAESMGLGGNAKVSRKGSIFASFRIRHLSNANMRMPNLGINTLNFHFGYIQSISDFGR